MTTPKFKIGQKVWKIYEEFDRGYDECPTCGHDSIWKERSLGWNIHDRKYPINQITIDDSRIYDKSSDRVLYSWNLPQFNNSSSGGLEEDVFATKKEALAEINRRNAERVQK